MNKACYIEIHRHIESALHEKKRALRGTLLLETEHIVASRYVKTFRQRNVIIRQKSRYGDAS